MCSGRVDPAFIMQALRLGADGVIVLGCHPGDCHYLTGNYETILKIAFTRKLLSLIGMENRLNLDWVSAAEGIRFGKVIDDFTKQIKALGPSPLLKEMENAALIEKFRALELSAESDRLRLLVARQRKVIERENVYGIRIPENNFDSTLVNAISDEYRRNRILLSLKNQPNSIKQLAKRLELETDEVLSHILALKTRGLITIEKVEGVSPVYTTI